MRVGPITVNGRQIGTIDYSEGESNPYTQKFGSDPGPHFHPHLGEPSGDDAPIVGRGPGDHYGHSPAAPQHKGRHGPGHFGGADGRHRQEEHHDTPHDGYFDSDIPAPARRPGGDVNVAPSERVQGQFMAARERARKELAEKPWLNEKAMHIFAGENPDPQASTALWESVINRAAVRHTNIETELRRTSEGGYYAGYNSEVSPKTREVLERSRDRALAGSNVSNYATDNSSGSKAAHEMSDGSFRHRSAFNGEHFFAPGSDEPKFRDRWDDMVYEAGAAQAAANSSTAPSRAAAGGASPQAFIMHHTGGRGDPASVVEDWRAHRPGIGTQFIMDRDGNIRDVRSEFGYSGTANIMPESRYRDTPILGDGQPFLNNSNIVGMEVIAKDDKDVTPAQVAAAKAFIAHNYPDTPVFGHGLVNPGHREADEGMTITNAIRADRARQAKSASEADFDPGTTTP
jgi:hypothetical protein